jgi:hypothetical protein
VALSTYDPIKRTKATDSGSVPRSLDIPHPDATYRLVVADGDADRRPASGRTSGTTGGWGFVGHLHTSLGHQLLDVAVAQGESVVQPDAVADDLARKTVAPIEG